MRTAVVAPLVLLLLAACASPPAHPKAAPPAGPAAPPPGVVEFQVSPEKKQASLVQIRVLVDQLNGLIAKKDYESWLTHLDQDYVRTYSDPAKLRDVSARDPVLKSMGIKLKSLEDFFTYEVVPSRTNTQVDDITFLDENRVYVWTVVDNERFLLYLLKLYGKEGKISSW